MSRHQVQEKNRILQPEIFKNTLARKKEKSRHRGTDYRNTRTRLFWLEVVGVGGKKMEVNKYGS